MSRPGMTVVARQKEGNEPIRDGEFINGYFSSLEFKNETNAPIYIQDRLGSTQLVKVTRVNQKENIPNMLNPDRHVYEGVFTIRYMFSFEPSEAESVSNQFSKFSDYSPFYELISKRCLTNPFGDRNSLKPVLMEVLIRLDHSILNDDLPLYFMELGISLANLRNVDDLQNPQSLQELMRKRVDHLDDNTLMADDPAFFRYKVYVNTKDKVLDKLYIHVHGQVQEVPILYDPTREANSFEVFSKRSINPDGTSHPSRTKVYTLDEAFKKYDLATSVQDAFRVKENKLYESKLEKEMLDETNKIEQLKFSHDKLNAERKALKTKHKRDLEMIDLKYKAELDKEKRDRIKEDEKHQKELAIAKLRAIQETQRNIFGLITNVTGFVMQMSKHIKP